MSTENCYRPGFANIGTKEKVKRYRKGWLALGFTIVLMGLLIYFDLPRTYTIFIYVPATFSALCFLQAANSFCVYYGLKGQYNFDKKKQKVTETEHKTADGKASVNILIISLTIGFFVTLLSYLVL